MRFGDLTIGVAGHYRLYTFMQIIETDFELDNFGYVKERVRPTGRPLGHRWANYRCRAVLVMQVMDCHKLTGSGVPQRRYGDK